MEIGLKGKPGEFCRERGFFFTKKGEELGRVFGRWKHLGILRRSKPRIFEEFNLVFMEAQG